MTYASLLAVVTGAPDDDTMLETAAALAARQRAMLRWLPVLPVPDLAAADPWASGFIAAEVAEAAAEASRVFIDRSRAKAAALAGVHGLETTPGEFGPRLAFCEPEIAPWLSLERELPVTDLTVLAASTGRGEGPWSGVLGETLMSCRAPVMVVRGRRPSRSAGIGERLRVGLTRTRTELVFWPLMGAVNSVE